VKVQGKEMLKEFSPFKAAGGQRKATVQKVSNVKVEEDGVLNIEFSPVVESPMINAIEISRQGQQ